MGYKREGSRKGVSVATYCLRCSQLADSFHPDDGRDIFLRNIGSYNSQHGTTTQETGFFIVTLMKASNLTQH
jgi:hypothetical protein